MRSNLHSKEDVIAHQISVDYVDVSKRTPIYVIVMVKDRFLTIAYLFYEEMKKNYCRMKWNNIEMHIWKKVDIENEQNYNVRNNITFLYNNYINHTV